jgi:hypothetical protein
MAERVFYEYCGSMVDTFCYKYVFRINLMEIFEINDLSMLIVSSMDYKVLVDILVQ